LDFVPLPASDLYTKGSGPLELRGTSRKKLSASDDQQIVRACAAMILFKADQFPPRGDNAYGKKFSTSTGTYLISSVPISAESDLYHYLKNLVRFLSDRLIPVWYLISYLTNFLSHKLNIR
jgi:hypothetical protein